jgi:MFS transporter, DHA1 family, tetracycline resistance protein
MTRSWCNLPNVFFGGREMSASAPKRQAAIVFIVITLILDIIGLGIIIPVLPELIKQLVGGNETNAAYYYGAIASAYALMQFFFSPVLGALSDRFGRRPIILIALFGLGVDYLFQAFAPTIGWLIVGRLIAGVAGGSISTANAYIADISTPETRARNFGLVGASFGVGFVLGPLLGGVLGGINTRLPFIVAAVLVLINFLYGLFILPESLAKENRSNFSWLKASPTGSLGQLAKYPLVAAMAVAFVFISLAQSGLQTTWVLYTGYRFGWGEMMNGVTLALVGVMALIVQGFLISPITKRFGERQTILMGLGIGVIGFALYGLSWQGWMMFVSIVIGAFAGIGGPAIQGLIAGSVEPSEQGKVQGGLTSIISLSSIFAPLIFTTGLFGYFTSAAAPFKLPGAPFYLGAFLNLIAVLLVARAFRRNLPKEVSEVAETPQAVSSIH